MAATRTPGQTPSIPHAARDVHLGLSKRSITQLNRNTDLARNARSATSQAQTPAGDNAMGLTLTNGCPPAPPVPRGGQVPSGSCSSDSAEGRSRCETSAKPGFPRGLPSGAPALPAPGGGSREVPGPGVVRPPVFTRAAPGVWALQHLPCSRWGNHRDLPVPPG